MRLSEILGALTGDGDGGETVSPPDEWHQGRTLYGGLTSALCVQAAWNQIPSLPPLRSLQIAFVGPASGRVRFVARLLRRGRSAAFVAVEASGSDGPCARATLTFGAARDSSVVHLDAPAPLVPEPAGIRPVAPGSGPRFFSNFDVRFATGGHPFAAGGAHGSGEPRFAMWARHREDAALEPTIALVAIADVLPPGIAPLHAAPRPVSSMTWSVELLEPERATEWYLLRSASEHAADGYSVQTMGCWDRGGRCLALGRQTVALF